MNISIVIPVYNEDESLRELEAWIRKVMAANNFSYEIIMIDDGSTDASWEVINELRAANSHIKGVKFRRNYGKSAALKIGFAEAQGDVVITMDADLQDSPDEIPDLYKMITEGGLDLVSGWKKLRHDPLSKTIPSKFFNKVTRKISKIELHDFNCGLKAYKNEVVKNVDVYGERHRYIPLLAKWAGFKKIDEKIVQHYPRKYGITKFGLERYINGFLDLLTITFIGKFGKRPMHFFGFWGVLFSVGGFGILAFLTISKIIWQEYGIAERPLFYFGILMLIVGMQLFVTGFLAELTIRYSPQKDNYIIEDRI